MKYYNRAISIAYLVTLFMARLHTTRSWVSCFHILHLPLTRVSLMKW